MAVRLAFAFGPFMYFPVPPRIGTEENLPVISLPAGTQELLQLLAEKLINKPDEQKTMHLG